jgi:hypothetical protein
MRAPALANMKIYSTQKRMHSSGIDHVLAPRASRSLGLKFGPSVFGETLGMTLLPISAARVLKVR